jgi:hypothetical protein
MGNDAGRTSTYDREIRYVLRDHRAGTKNRSSSDVNTGQDDDPVGNPDIITYGYRPLHVKALLAHRHIKATEIMVRGPYDDVLTHHDVIANRYPSGQMGIYPYSGIISNGNVLARMKKSSALNIHVTATFGEHWSTDAIPEDLKKFSSRRVGRRQVLAESIIQNIANNPNEVLHC